ncbi:hypothetical protein AAY473_010300, partial [Plecturocebus cupreus]
MSCLYLDEWGRLSDEEQRQLFLSLVMESEAAFGEQEEGFHHVGQAGLKPLTSSDPPTLAFESAGITD